MLKKLLKYDIKYMFKSISIFYILSIFFAILTRIIFSLNQTVMIDIIGQISVGCMFAMIVNTLVNTIMRSWVRFKESIYKDESYLTHTLPVTKNNIYNSKIIFTIVYLLVGMLVVVFSLFIAYYTKDRFIIIRDFINNLIGNLNINTTYFIISIILLLFLEILNGIQSGFFGMIIGHKFNNNKTGLSVLFGFITYMCSQIFCIILFVIVIGAEAKSHINNMQEDIRKK